MYVNFYSFLFSLYNLMYLKEITSSNKLFYSQFKLSVLLLTKYYSGCQIRKNEMGGTCGTCGRQERCIGGFGEKT